MFHKCLKWLAEENAQMETLAVNRGRGRHLFTNNRRKVLSGIVLSQKILCWRNPDHLQASKCIILLASVSPQTVKSSKVEAVYKAESLPVLPHRQAASCHSGISARFLTQHYFLCFFLVPERGVKVGGERRK